MHLFRSRFVKSLSADMFDGMSNKHQDEVADERSAYMSDYDLSVNTNNVSMASSSCSLLDENLDYVKLVRLVNKPVGAKVQITCLSLDKLLKFMLKFHLYKYKFTI